MDVHKTIINDNSININENNVNKLISLLNELNIEDINNNINLKIIMMILLKMIFLIMKIWKN